jgi:hypothetical protein
MRPLRREEIEGAVNPFDRDVIQRIEPVRSVQGYSQDAVDGDIDNDLVMGRCIFEAVEHHRLSCIWR